MYYIYFIFIIIIYYILAFGFGQSLQLDGTYNIFPLCGYLAKPLT